ncbi:MAG: TRAP transporter small permease subunit [Thermodesulfobacteriota bacterium]
MSKAVQVVFDLIEKISEKSGAAASYIIVAVMLITTVEVVGRYAFNHPTSWAWPLNRQLFGVFILFGGVYAMKTGTHIRIEILYEYMPPKVRLAARLLALACFLGFLGVLVWQSGWMGYNSWSMGEKAPGAFRVPLYPFKIMIPLVSLLFLLEGIVVFFRNRD